MNGKQNLRVKVHLLRNGVRIKIQNFVKNLAPQTRFKFGTSRFCAAPQNLQLFTVSFNTFYRCLLINCFSEYYFRYYSPVLSVLPVFSCVHLTGKGRQGRIVRREANHSIGLIHNILFSRYMFELI